MQYEPLAESEPEPEAEPQVVPSKSPSDTLGTTRGNRLEQLMLSAMGGHLFRGRALKYWENLKLKPVHINMLLMRAAGFSNNYIADQLDYEPSRVSVIVNHPDAQAVLAVLVSFQAEELLDVKTRIQAHSGEALNVVLDLMRNAPEASVRAKTAFSLLDRAGYGAVQRVESKVTINIPSAAAQGISSAISEAQSVEDADYIFEDPPVDPIVAEADLDSGTGEPSDEGRSLSDSGEPPVTSYPGSPSAAPHIQIRRSA